MLSAFLWFVVTTGSAVAITAALRAVRLLIPAGRARDSVRTALLAGALVLVALVVLALLLKIRPFAEADAAIVRELAASRTATLISVSTVVTTMGDVVPSLCIAAALGLWLYLSSRSLSAVVLPTIVLVEIAAQFAIGNVVRDFAISDVAPTLGIGGAGLLPSGSVARLFSIFVIAGLLWRSVEPAVGRRLTVLGGVLVLVELTTRLYLGRHFVTDIAGGLLLGLLLVGVAMWCVAPFARPVGTPDRRFEVGGFGADSARLSR